MTASGQDSAPRNSLRGSTRGTGEWHIYTAIYDERKSEMFVDGYCEASAKNVGNNKLDGLSIGCDHNGVFFLSGAIAELRLLHGHIPTAQRVQMEAALARRYGLVLVRADAPTAPAKTGRASFSCAPRFGGSGAAAAAALRTASTEGRAAAGRDALDASRRAVIYCHHLLYSSCLTRSCRHADSRPPAP